MHAHLHRHCTPLPLFVCSDHGCRHEANAVSYETQHHCQFASSAGHRRRQLCETRAGRKTPYRQRPTRDKVETNMQTELFRSGNARSLWLPTKAACCMCRQLGRVVEFEEKAHFRFRSDIPNIHAHHVKGLGLEMLSSILLLSWRSMILGPRTRLACYGHGTALRVIVMCQL